MRRRLLPAATCLLVAATLQAQLEPVDRWIRLDTGHFTLFSDAPIETVQALSRNLELLHSVLARLNPERTIKSPLPTWVFIFRDQESFGPYRLRMNGRSSAISGYFLSHPHANFVAIDGSSGMGASRIVYHEYLHYFARHNLPGLPLWFNEGLAEFYTTFERHEDEVTIGKPVERHVEWLRTNGLIPFRRFLDTDTDSAIYNEQDRNGGYYAQSWALVHMLLASNQERRRQVTRYLDLLSEGTDAGEALQIAFGKAPRGLQQELEEYLRAQRFDLFRQSLDGIDAVGIDAVGIDAVGIDAVGTDEADSVEVSRVAPAEVLYRLGSLLTHFNPARLVEAGRHFDAALRLDPDYALAWAGRGYIRYLRSDYEGAHVLYEQALERGPREFLIHFLSGINLMKWVGAESGFTPEGPEQQARLEKARAAFRRSISLKSDFAEAYAGLGSSFVGADDPSEDGLEALRKARSSLPHRADITFNMAILAARLGHHQLAVDLVEGVLVTQADAETVDNVREGLLRVELTAADRQLRDGELEVGLEIIESVIERTIDSDLFSELIRKADEIRRMLAARADRELFNEAMDLAAKSRYDEAIERLEELIAATEDKELRKVAKENLRRLRQLP